MGNKFIIPSIFTAVDQMSPTMLTMRQNVMEFGTKVESSIARADRIFRKLTPGLSDARKQVMSLVGAGAMIAGAFQLGNFSFNAVADYEQSVDSFRTIVSDLNDTQFADYQKAIDSVAGTTRRSATDVARSFEKIAGLNATFASTAQGIGQVSQASITLAKASGMELGPAAENLVGIMNQFSFAADQANRTINVLAAGQAVGAANISQTAEAFTVFGSVAAGANITLEQSVGLIQTLGKFSLFGAEAGTKLRGAILRLQKAGIGYTSGQFNMNDALNQTNEMLAKVASAKKRDQIINKLFGVENVTAGRILLNNIDTIKNFTSGVTGTSEAQKAAAINTGNLRSALQELSAEWVNYLTGSAGSKSATSELTGAVQWLRTNLDGVVGTVITAVKWYAIIKGSLFAAKAAMTAYNITLGLSSAIQGASSLALKHNTTALAAQRVGLMLTKSSLVGTTVATEGATAATLSFGAAWAANPIGVIALGIGALASGIAYLSFKQKELNDEYERQSELNITTHINAQIQATSQLAKKWQEVGYNTHDATVKALQYQVMTAQQNVAKAITKKQDTENRLRQATDEAFFPAFNSEVSRLRTELASTKSALTLAMSDKLGATSSVEGAIRSGLLTSVEGNNILQGKSMKFATKADMTQPAARESFATVDQKAIDDISAILKASMNSTITIKNDSENTVAVESGKSRPVDVMPKTTSTKPLRAVFDR